MSHTLKDIGAADIRAYLINAGWTQNEGFPNPNMLVFTRHAGEQTIAIPANKEFDDFYPNLKRLVERLARCGKKSEQEIIDDIVAAGERSDDPMRKLEHIETLSPAEVDSVVKQTMASAASDMQGAIDLLKKAKEEEQKDDAQFWKEEFFSFLSAMTTTTHGKQMYFLQDDEKTVYSRISGSYMPVRDAEKEYLGELSEKEGIF